MHIKKEVLDELINDYKRPEDLIGEKGLIQSLLVLEVTRGGRWSMMPTHGYSLCSDFFESSPEKPQL